jgi:crotonobetainyl-CoA:carnitine CoA-transferase CaiB-like acyl-CoA transferase
MPACLPRAASHTRRPTDSSSLRPTTTSSSRPCSTSWTSPQDVRRQPIRTMEERQKNWPSIYALLSKAFTGRPSADWVRLCAEAAVPCTVVRAVSDLVNDPHLRQVGLFQVSEHPSEGKVREIRPTTRWSSADVSIHCHAPRLGEHSAEILKEIGYTDSQIVGW